MELHHFFIIGRTPLVTDVLIDGVGAFVGVAMYFGSHAGKYARYDSHR